MVKWVCVGGGKWFLLFLMIFFAENLVKLQKKKKSKMAKEFDFAGKERANRVVPTTLLIGVT